VTVREDDSDRQERGRIAVALSFADDELGSRVRALIANRSGFYIVDAGDDSGLNRVLITDGAVDSAHEVPVLVLIDPMDAVHALRAGAAAVLAVDVDGDTLSAAITAAVRGLTTLSAEAREHTFDAVRSRSGLDAESDDTAQLELTPRELAVLQLLAEGASNKAIGRRLGITSHTAKFHVASILAKLNASGRTDAVAKAMRLGLIMV
jgi:DNA-binding NarL/FixJ family response regulator